MWMHRTICGRNPLEKAVLSLAPAHAIVFAKGDQVIFFIYGISNMPCGNRPDLAIVATDLLSI